MAANTMPRSQKGTDKTSAVAPSAWILLLCAIEGCAAENGRGTRKACDTGCIVVCIVGAFLVLAGCGVAVGWWRHSKKKKADKEAAEKEAEDQAAIRAAEARAAERAAEVWEATCADLDTAQV
jgi:hypothetical protein